MLRNRRLLCLALSIGLSSPSMILAQEGLKQRSEASPAAPEVRVDAGTHILLNMINSVSTKHAAPGDRIYLETAFPVLVKERIVVPQGSWVTGTITEVKRPGRVKGRGTLQVRFDSLTLPNGVSRNFRSDLGAVDARSDETLQREGSKVESGGSKGRDVGTVIGTTAAGTVIGAGIGGASRNAGNGGAIGAGAGAAAGVIGVLVTRGPDAMLSKGSTVEMVLDRPISFNSADLNFNGAPPGARLSEGEAPSQSRSHETAPRLPF